MKTFKTVQTTKIHLSSGNVAKLSMTRTYAKVKEDGDKMFKDKTSHDELNTFSIRNQFGVELDECSVQDGKEISEFAFEVLGYFPIETLWDAIGVCQDDDGNWVTVDEYFDKIEEEADKEEELDAVNRLQKLGFEVILKKNK